MKHVLLILIPFFFSSFSFADFAPIKELRCEEISTTDNRKTLEYNAKFNSMALNQIVDGEITDSMQFAVVKNEQNGNLLHLVGQQITMIESWNKLVITLDLSSGLTQQAYIQPMWINSEDGEVVHLATLSCFIKL